MLEFVFGFLLGVLAMIGLTGTLAWWLVSGANRQAAAKLLEGFALILAAKPKPPPAAAPQPLARPVAAGTAAKAPAKAPAAAAASGAKARRGQWRQKPAGGRAQVQQRQQAPVAGRCAEAGKTQRRQNRGAWP